MAITYPVTARIKLTYEIDTSPVTTETFTVIEYTLQNELAKKVIDQINNITVEKLEVARSSNNYLKYLLALLQ